MPVPTTRKESRRAIRRSEIPPHATPTFDRVGRWIRCPTLSWIERNYIEISSRFHISDRLYDIWYCNAETHSKPERNIFVLFTIWSCFQGGILSFRDKNHQINHIKLQFPWDKNNPRLKISCILWTLNYDWHRPMPEENHVLATTRELSTRNTISCVRVLM